MTKGRSDVLSLVEPIVILSAMQFAIALPIGLVHGRFLLSALASAIYLAVSPRLIYSVNDVVLAILGYFVSDGGLLILVTSVGINYLGWEVGRWLGRIYSKP